MRTVEKNVELRITDDDVDHLGQLLDLEATLAPFGPAVRRLDEQLAAAFLNGQATEPEGRIQRDVE